MIVVDAISAFLGLGLSYLAGEGRRQLGERVLADLPPAVRSNPEVMERYAALDDRRGVIDFFKEAITGWFVFFVVLFAGMTAADFSLGFQLLLAAGLGLIWASAQHADHIEDELSFWKTIPDPGAGNRRALRFTYWFLAVGTWVGWLMAAALAGHLIAAAGGL